MTILSEDARDCILDALKTGTLDPNDVLSEGEKEQIRRVCLDAPAWDCDVIQFPRLITEIAATFSEIDIPGLCESMDLEPDHVDALLERAHIQWERAKDAYPRLPANWACPACGCDEVSANGTLACPQCAEPINRRAETRPS